MDEEDDDHENDDDEEDDDHHDEDEGRDRVLSSSSPSICHLMLCSAMISIHPLIQPSIHPSLLISSH